MKRYVCSLLVATGLLLAVSAQASRVEHDAHKAVVSKAEKAVDTTVVVGVNSLDQYAEAPAPVSVVKTVVGFGQVNFDRHTSASKVAVRTRVGERPGRDLLNFYSMYRVS